VVEKAIHNGEGIEKVDWGWIIQPIGLIGEGVFLRARRDWESMSDPRAEFTVRSGIFVVAGDPA
jgi:hypothetical protein